MKHAFVDPLSDDTNRDLAEMKGFYAETLGFVPNSLMTMMHRPQIANAFLEMNRAVMANNGKLTSELKRLIAYLSSMTTGCRYCEAHAIRAAERYGASQDRLEEIWDFETSNAFTDAERTLFRLAIAASKVPNEVDSQIMANVKKFWDDGDIVEAMGVIALFGYLNRWNDSMATRIENAAVQSGNKYLKKHNWNVGKHM